MCNKQITNIGYVDDTTLIADRRQSIYHANSEYSRLPREIEREEHSWQIARKKPQ